MTEGERVLRSRFKELVAQIERAENRPIQQQEIAQETGLDDHTISRWMGPKPFKRFESDTVLRLCQYASMRLGKPVEIGDLLHIDYMPTQS